MTLTLTFMQLRVKSAQTADWIVSFAGNCRIKDLCVSERYMMTKRNLPPSCTEVDYVCHLASGWVVQVIILGFYPRGSPQFIALHVVVLIALSGATRSNSLS